MASLTTMKFAAQTTMTPRTAASATCRSEDSRTPAGRSAGVGDAAGMSGSMLSASRSVSGASDGVALELEQLLLVLLGELQPDEQPGKDDKWDDDERRKRDAE